MHWLLLAVITIATTSPLAASTDADPMGGPRLRPRGERTASWLEEGLAKSSSVRALADTLARGDLIVYIVADPQLPRHLDGGLAWQARAGKFRYVRISLNPRLTRIQAIATLAHELQHAVEVLEAPEVVCSLSLRNYFRRIGTSRERDGHAWDTDAAIDMGRVVKRDLLQTSTVATATESAAHRGG